MSKEKEKVYSELLVAANKVVAARRGDERLIPVEETLVSVRVAKDTYVSLGWLTQPKIEIGGKSYAIFDLINVTSDAALLKSALDIWCEQFLLAVPESNWDEYRRNTAALGVIFDSIRSDRDFKVYVPLLDATFTNIGIIQGPVYDAASTEGRLAELIGTYHVFYCKHVKGIPMDTPGLGPFGLGRCDRELTDEEREAAAKEVKKLERVRRKIAEEEEFKMTTTRKLRMQLKYLARKRPSKIVLDVAGWVVPLKEVEEGEFMIDLPWVKRELTSDEFHDYVKAQSKPIPVGWEYLYMIDEALQALR